MRLARNIAIRFTAVMVCVIAMILSAALTFIVNVIALFVAPIAIAAYAAVFGWTGDDELSARWEFNMYRTQAIFDPPVRTGWGLRDIHRPCSENVNPTKGRQ